jgi:diguanylate cyclase (GGDEF)-like protein/PAS domain S-box-containing protein
VSSASAQPFRSARSTITLRTLSIRLALVLVGYYVCGRLGLAIPQVGTQVSLFWAPSGVALAAVIVWGPWMASAVALAAVAVNIAAGASTALATLIAVGNSGAALIAAHLLQRLGFSQLLERRRDLGLLIGVGALGGSLLAATNGVISLALGGPFSMTELGRAWLVWWLGDALGVAVVAVPLLALSRQPGSMIRRGQRSATSALLALTVVGVSAAVFVTLPSATVQLSAWLFVPHVLLAWLATRGGIFPTSATVVVVALVAATATAFGLGPFAQPQTTGALTLLWGYLCTLTAVGLLISSYSGELADSEERWQIALEGADIGVADWELRRGRGFRSHRWLALLGLAIDDDKDRFEDWLAAVHPDDQAELRRALQAPEPDSLGHFRRDIRIRGADGAWRWFACDASIAERNAQATPTRLVVTIADVNARRAATERHRLSTHLFQNLHEGILIADAQLRVLDVNQAFCSLTGETRESLLGTVPALLGAKAGEVEGSVDSAERKAIWESLRERGAWAGEIVEAGDDGQPRALRVTIASVQRDDTPPYLTVVVSDVTEQHRQRAQLERQAHFDELTGLPNRTRLAQMLADALRSSDEEGFLLTLCYIDLDHFKEVNDQHGHAVGDRVLVEMAKRLRGGLRRGGKWVDAVARLSGDEFVLLMRSSSLDESRQAVERMLQLISQPYRIEGAAQPLKLSASIGATVYPLDRADAETLLRHADHAMYGAKQGGRDGFLFFDTEQSRRSEARVLAVGRIQDALQQGELMLYYQPKVNMRTGRLLGVEALLRWIHPDHGVIGPSGFLPLIEHTILGATVGDWVLENGIAQLVRWLDAGLDLSMSINVSARHLQSPDFVPRLEQLLAPHRPQVAARLELEVLETAALADIDYTSSLMERCRARGVRFALDDFGTGYSNLTYLKQLPVDVLKIDRSFVHGMLADSENLAIVEGVVRLARTFDCLAVAEGVESAEQARKLLSVGCEIGQGIGIGAPMPAEEVPGWARHHRGILDGPRAVAF